MNREDHKHIMSRALYAASAVCLSSVFTVFHISAFILPAENQLMRGGEGDEEGEKKEGG